MYLSLLLALGQSFTIHPLPLGSYDGGEVVSIASDGSAAGTLYTNNGYYTAVKWLPNGTLVELGRWGGHSWSSAINSDGLVLGTTYLAYQDLHPYLWDVAGWPATSLTGAASIDMNNAGDILLQQNMTGILLPRDGRQVSFFVGDGSLQALDDTGAACGFHSGVAFRWHQGILQDLPPAQGFQYSLAWDLSGSLVVGQSRTDSTDQATTWDLAGAPALLPYFEPGSDQSLARACNSQGWVVGYEWSSRREDTEVGPVKAVLWINSLPQALPLGAPYDVNSNGQIVGLSFQGLPVRLDPL